MADPTITLTVSTLPTATPTTAKIEETPIALDTVSLSVGTTMPVASVGATVYIARPFKYGVLKASPGIFGHCAIDNQTPKYWFQWGDMLAIDPLPDNVANYLMMMHKADYPTRGMDATYYPVPSDLPEEFQELLVDFACYVLSLKLKKWKQASRHYNIYTQNLSLRKQEYINRKAEKRLLRDLPINVSNPLRKEVDDRKRQSIPDNVVYQNGRQWQH